jgi:hypothetical protein
MLMEEKTISTVKDATDFLLLLMVEVNDCIVDLVRLKRNIAMKLCSMLPEEQRMLSDGFGC